MIKLLILSTVLFFVSCTSSKKIMAPSGKEGHMVTCPRNVSNCYEKAAELCPKGYNEISKSDSSSGATVIGNNIVTSKKFEMMIECK